MYPIWIVVGTREAWEEVKVRRRAGGHHRGELGHDVREAIAVPERRSAVHGRADKIPTIRVLDTGLKKMLPETF
jgi:hypothetical protein